MAKCVFAGTFDPVTVGHLEIIEKCAKDYQQVLVVIGKNDKKDCLLTEKERLQLTKKAFEHNSKIKVVLYSDYLDKYADFLKENGYTVYLRGIRNQTDLDFEKQMEQLNQKRYPFIKTEYVWASDEYKTVSSTLVKGLITEKKEYLKYIPSQCHTLLESILQDKQVKN